MGTISWTWMWTVCRVWACLTQTIACFLPFECDAWHIRVYVIMGPPNGRIEPFLTHMGVIALEQLSMDFTTFFSANGGLAVYISVAAVLTRNYCTTFVLFWHGLRSSFSTTRFFNKGFLGSKKLGQMEKLCGIFHSMTYFSKRI